LISQQPVNFYDNICDDPVPEHDDSVFELKPYVSKYAPKTEEAAAEEEELVERELAVPAIDTASLVGPMANGQVHQQGLDETRLKKFIVGVARLIIEVYG
jgi:hypothetical protein